MTALKIENNTPHFFESIYSALFEPFQFYELLSSSWPKNSIHLLYAALIVSLISGLGVFLIDPNSLETITGWSVFSAFMASVFGLLFWLLTAVIFASLAYSFRSNGRLGILLTLTGYAMLPWVLSAPLVISSSSISFGNPLAEVLILFTGLAAILIWTTVLFLAAIQKTYSLSFDRVLLVSAVPLMIAALGIVWTLGSLSSVFTLFG
jgi:hypothetical protein